MGSRRRQPITDAGREMLDQTREDVMTDVLCRASFGKFTEDDMRRIARQLDRAILAASPTPDETVPVVREGLDEVEVLRATVNELGPALEAHHRRDQALRGPTSGGVDLTCRTCDAARLSEDARHGK